MVLQSGVDKNDLYPSIGRILYQSLGLSLTFKVGFHMEIRRDKER